MTSTESPAERVARRANGWPVLPLRVFLAALFLFAGYAKLTYPHFFDPGSLGGFKASVDAARTGTPLGGVLGPLSHHPSLFGHVTAYAELAIGLGLLVGLLTRGAALGGMVLVAMIVLSINWNGVKEYTGSSGWFTSVDLAVGAALSVFLLGGADPFSLDALFWRARQRRRLADDGEPGFRDNDLAESRARLQGRPYDEADYPTQAYPDGHQTQAYPDGHQTQAYPDGQPGQGFQQQGSREDYRGPASRADYAGPASPDRPREDEHRTQQLPVAENPERD